MSNQFNLRVLLVLSTVLGASVFAASEIVGFSLLLTFLFTLVAGQAYFWVAALEDGITDRGARS